MDRNFLINYINADTVFLSFLHNYYSFLIAPLNTTRVPPEEVVLLKILLSLCREKLTIPRLHQLYMFTPQPYIYSDLVSPATCQGSWPGLGSTLPSSSGTRLESRTLKNVLNLILTGYAQGCMSVLVSPGTCLGS